MDEDNLSWFCLSLNQELTFFLKSVLTGQNLGIQRERENTYLSFSQLMIIFLVADSETPGTVGKKRE